MRDLRNVWRAWGKKKIVKTLISTNIAISRVFRYKKVVSVVQFFRSLLKLSLLGLFSPTYDMPANPYFSLAKCNTVIRIANRTKAHISRTVT